MRKATLAAGALAFLLGAVTEKARAASYPVTPNIVVGGAIAAVNPQTVPAGANIVSCLSSVDSYPVVLVNGTFSVMEDDFGGIAPDLANAGYCLYMFNYGYTHPTDLIEAIGPVAASAQQLASFVESVKKITGAQQVDLVGHSQGGLLTEYYAKILNGAANVHSIVALSPTTHGTTLDGITELAAFFPGANQIVGDACPACSDQEVGSAVVMAVDNGPIAQPGVKYTVIETLDETVVTPVGSSFISEAGVTNEYVQRFCPLDAVDHADLAYDNVVIQLVKNALTPGRARKPNCLQEFPVSTH